MIGADARAGARGGRPEPHHARSQDAVRFAADDPAVLLAVAVLGARPRREVHARRSPDRDVAAGRWHGPRRAWARCRSRRPRPEILLLEYATATCRWPTWAGAAPRSPQMRDTWRLHTEAYDLTQRTPYLARKMGSALMSKVAAAVTSARSLGFGVVGPGGPRREVRRLRGPRHEHLESRGHDGRVVAADRLSAQPDAARRRADVRGARGFPTRSCRCTRATSRSRSSRCATRRR